jgi:hypothetical protein
VGLKSSFTPLERVKRLDDQSLDRLRAAHVSTVEEFVGLLYADRQALQQLLHLDEHELEEVGASALDLLPPARREAYARSAGVERSLGALDPRYR